MPSTPVGVRNALRALQGRIRQRPAAGEPIVKTLRAERDGVALEVPLATGQVAAMKAAEAAVAADLHFEHLDPAESEIEQFTVDCATDRGTDHVRPFMERYSKEPVDRVCYFAVEVLGTDLPAEFCGIRLLAPDDPEVPALLSKLDPAARSVAAVAVAGTGLVLMAARARRHAEHALSILRLALRQFPGVNTRQLRFRLGIGHACR
jgi:hypothetical protein